MQAPRAVQRQEDGQEHGPQGREEPEVHAVELEQAPAVQAGGLDLLLGGRGPDLRDPAEVASARQGGGGLAVSGRGAREDGRRDVAQHAEGRPQENGARAAEDQGAPQDWVVIIITTTILLLLLLLLLIIIITIVIVIRKTIIMIITINNSNNNNNHHHHTSNHNTTGSSSGPSRPRGRCSARPPGGPDLTDTFAHYCCYCIFLCMLLLMCCYCSVISVK